MVTGSAGMLGSAVVREMRNQGGFEVIEVTRATLDLRDADGFREVLRASKPEAVLHAAARVGGIAANVESPVDFLASNLQMDTNVILSCIEAGIANFVYIGSSCMYPKDFRQPLVESDILRGPLEPTNEGYALAKIAGSKLCEYASRSLGLNYRTIIPSNLYGPGDNFKHGSSHLLASVIRKVHEAKASGASEIQVWGSGSARREFTYIEDLATWVVDSFKMQKDFPPLLNVGLGRDFTVNEFYVMAMEALNVSATLIHDLTKPEGMAAKLMDSSLARREFGWSPETSVESGIGKTYAWYLNNLKGD
jgi:GDP-L-fucose synthase